MNSNLTLVLCLFFVIPSFANAQASCDARPGVYKFKLGRWDAFMINDGIYADFSPFFNVPASAVLRSFRYYNGPKTPFRGFANVLVLRSARDVILVDAGAGSEDLSAFGGTVGKFIPLLKSVGIKPRDVTKVFITHAHQDHIGGLLKKNNGRAFPNAFVYLHPNEHNFWLKPSAEILKTFPLLPPGLVTGTTSVYQRVTRAYGNRIKLLRNRQRVAGVQLLLTAGHTPGHSVYRIRTGRGTSHVAVGDQYFTRTTLIQNYAWSVITDTNRTAAIEARFKLANMLAHRQPTIHSYHQAFPGIGYLIRDKDSFDFSTTVRIPQN